MKCHAFVLSFGVILGLLAACHAATPSHSEGSKASAIAARHFPSSKRTGPPTWFPWQSSNRNSSVNNGRVAPRWKVQHETTKTQLDNPIRFASAQEEIATPDPIERNESEGQIELDTETIVYPPRGAWCVDRWFRAEYLPFWTDGMNTPPLVTSSPAGTAQNIAGVLGEPTTTVLFGDDPLNDGYQSGGRFTLGYRQPDCGIGMELAYMLVGEESTDFSSTSQGEPALARPFFNVETGLNDSALVAFSGLFDGSVAVTGSTEFHSAEILRRKAMCTQCGYELESIIGYRFNRLENELSINQSTLATGGVSQGTTTQLSDSFVTRSDFHGGVIGTAVTYRHCRWSVEVAGKMALGNSRSKATVRGTTTVTDVGGNVATTGEGLLAQDTNIGTRKRNDFAVVPEIGITVAYDLTGCFKATFGYRFIYWSQVARAGDQVDLDLNLSEPFVGAARPELNFPTTDYWAQGLGAGLEYSY